MGVMEAQRERQAWVRPGIRLLQGQLSKAQDDARGCVAVAHERCDRLHLRGVGLCVPFSV